MPYLDSCFPFPIDEATLIDLAHKARDWALMHGIAVRSKHNFYEELRFAPFVLLPTLFPRREFEKAVRLQPIFNELMHWVAHDTEFLRETLANAIEVDEFTRKLFNIHERILAEDNSALERPSLGLFRSDYLMNSLESNEIKQVEINTMAVSLAGFASRINELHSYVLSELNHDGKIVNLSKNNALAGLCDALIEAWNLQSKPNASILIITLENTNNICDQRMIEYYIRKKHPEIKVIRRTFTELHQQVKLGPNNELLINNREVSVVYFRAAFMPRHYPTQNEWDLRYLVEKSAAIKCPPIHYQLAGTKKVQQALAKPSNLRRFLKDDSKINAITNTFMGLYSMDSETEDGRNAFQMALNNPEKYVLKPEREGGGNNVYGHDIPDAIRKMSDDERSSWILMEKIFPPISKGYIIRPGDQMPPKLDDLVSEIGIFGAVIGNKNGIVHNSNFGHLLRTKPKNSNEVSILYGYGAVDNPYLYDD